MSTPSYGRPSHYARRGGFSLIEVAIALAIFVFGALAIVQIFPPALGVIRNNESRITATQLGKSTLAQFRNKTSPPPEAIFDVDATITDPYNPYQWNDYPASVVGTSNKNNSLPQTVTDFNASALGHFQYIYGEPHYLEAGQLLLLNRPLDTSGTVISTVERTIEGVQIDENGYLDFAYAYMTDGTTFNTPYNSQSTPFNNGGKRPPTGYRQTKVPETEYTYYVSYQWREASSPTIIRGVLEEPLIIPADSDWMTGDPARVLPCTINPANKAIPGAVQVKIRMGVPVTVSPPGTLSFPMTDLFYVSYLSKDWREMTDLSAPVNNIVQLPINGIEENSVSGTLTNFDHTVIPGSGVASVNYKDGIVTYSSPVPAGARSRTTYRTLDGWATQTSVAPRTYVPYFVGERTNPWFPREPWREYVWSPADPTNIYFHASEAGKTVAVSYGVNNAPISTTLIIDNIQGVPTAAWWTANFGGFAPSGKVARVTLTEPDGDPATGATSLFSVQGLSIHARTAWLNADKYNQVIVPAYRNLLQ